MIQAVGLTKYYGDITAIRNVSFNINKGEIVGFLGPNGAGKTTTMRIITGFIPPSTGTATVAGNDVVEKSLDVRKRIGYLPETVPLYTDMAVDSYLKFMGSIRGMNPRRIKQRVPEVIELCRLGDYYHTFIGKLSKGYRQRVGIAQAILHEPDVLILDEPTIGIDPLQVVETRKLMKDLGGEHTLILSSHILPEVSMLCERVLIIHEGEIVADDTPEKISGRLRGSERIDLEVRGPATNVLDAIKKVNGVMDVTASGDGDRNKYTIRAERGLDLREGLARAVVNNNWGLLSLEWVAMSLEDIFIQVTKGLKMDEEEIR